MSMLNIIKICSQGCRGSKLTEIVIMIESRAEKYGFPTFKV